MRSRLHVFGFFKVFPVRSSSLITAPVCFVALPLFPNVLKKWKNTWFYHAVTTLDKNFRVNILENTQDGVSFPMMSLWDRFLLFTLMKHSLEVNHSTILRLKDAAYFFWLTDCPSILCFVFLCMFYLFMTDHKKWKNTFWKGIQTKHHEEGSPKIYPGSA